MKALHQFQRRTQYRLVRKILVIDLIVGWILLSLVSTSVAITLKFSVYPPSNHVWITGVKKFKEQIERVSKEKIHIKIVPPNKYRNPQELLYGVQNGNIDIALLDSFYMGKIVGAIKIFRLPFLFRDKIQSLPFLYGSVARALLKEIDKHGFVGIGFVSSEPNVLINTVKPIKNLNDLKGLKMATFGFPTQLETIKAMGAVPVLWLGKIHIRL